MSHRWRLINALLSLLYIIGCSGSPAPTKGGTFGTLTFADGVTSDINVTVNQAIDGGFQQTGFGTTGLEGPLSFIKWELPGHYGWSRVTTSLLWNPSGHRLHFRKNIAVPRRLRLK